MSAAPSALRFSVDSLPPRSTEDSAAKVIGRVTINRDFPTGNESPKTANFVDALAAARVSNVCFPIGTGRCKLPRPEGREAAVKQVDSTAAEKVVAITRWLTARVGLDCSNVEQPLHRVVSAGIAFQP